LTKAEKKILVANAVVTGIQEEDNVSWLFSLFLERLERLGVWRENNS